MNELEKKIEKLISEKEQIQKHSKLKLKNNNLKNIDKVVVSSNTKTKNTKDSLTEKNNLVENVGEKATTKRIKLISHLRLARKAHIAWVSNVQILIQLGNIDEAKVSTPINYTVCAFGKWYYGDGQVLTPFKEYRDIEEVHQQIHSTYLEIFSMYNEKLEGSLFTSVKKLEKERKEKAIKLEIILKEYSKLMFDLLVALEMKIKRMSDAEINAL